jgi:hypothetical protein
LLSRKERPTVAIVDITTINRSSKPKSTNAPRVYLVLMATNVKKITPTISEKLVS